MASTWLVHVAYMSCTRRSSVWKEMAVFAMFSTPEPSRRMRVPYSTRPPDWLDIWALRPEWTRLDCKLRNRREKWNYNLWRATVSRPLSRRSPGLAKPNKLVRAGSGKPTLKNVWEPENPRPLFSGWRTNIVSSRGIRSANGAPSMQH
jgi:hypothetical protein